LLTALPRAFRVLTDPADCGPVTLAFCQDVQAEAYDYPEAFFEPKVWRQRRVRPDGNELQIWPMLSKAAKRPVIVAGGGVHYSDATSELAAFAEAHNIPVVETQAGKSALPWDHPLNLGPIGVTGGEAANSVCAERGFGDWRWNAVSKILQQDHGGYLPTQIGVACLNVAAYDAMKHGAMPLLADARWDWGTERRTWTITHQPPHIDGLKEDWFAKVDPLTDAPADSNALPTDMQVWARCNAAHATTACDVCRGHHAGRVAQTVESGAAPCPIIWNMALAVWDMKSRAPWALKWLSLNAMFLFYG
jgi:3D-(3,5/4)-trihydroxycyclohexane-1,2-dione acylhydrolase (decyclizing)